MSRNILLLPGDGIGKEITNQARKVLEFFNSLGFEMDLSEGFIGGSAIDEYGSPLPEETLSLARSADAVLLAAIGGPKWDDVDFAIRPEAGLLGIREGMNLFANLRPALVFEELANSSSLRRDIVSGLDIMIVRELIGGIYFGKPSGIEVRGGEKVGYNTLVYSESEIRRIARVSFELAMQRGKRLCSIDKANVLDVMVLWRKVVTEISIEYPEVELLHMYVDNASMQLVRNPKQFDVIVTSNMFGDILSDTAAMLTGSLGMLPSASLGMRDASGKMPALYEPVHGSAPDIAGQNKANPLAQLLSLSMMLRYSFDEMELADNLDKAIQLVLKDNIRTADIAEKGSIIVGTDEMGDEVIKRLRQIYS